MTGEPANIGAEGPSPILVLVRAIAFGALAGGGSAPLAALGWILIDSGAQYDDNLLIFLLLSFIPGVGVGLILGLIYGVILSIWTWVGQPDMSAVRLALSAVAILLDAVLVWRYRLEPVLAIVALPFAWVSIWIGTHLVLRAPEWVDDFAARL